MPVFFVFIVPAYLLSLLSLLTNFTFAVNLPMIPPLLLCVHILHCICCMQFRLKPSLHLKQDHFPKVFVLFSCSLELWSSQRWIRFHFHTRDFFSKSITCKQASFNLYLWIHSLSFSRVPQSRIDPQNPNLLTTKPLQGGLLLLFGWVLPLTSLVELQTGKNIICLFGLNLF